MTKVYIQPETSGFTVTTTGEDIDGRKCYAMTTAQEAVYMVACELGLEAWWLDHFGEGQISTTRGTSQVTSDFKKGDRVWSKRFGWGEVVQVHEHEAYTYPVRVIFSDYEEEEGFRSDGSWSSTGASSSRNINVEKPE